MKRFLFLLLLMLLPAELQAQSRGFYVRKDCTTLLQPVADEVVCLNIGEGTLAAGGLYLYDGANWTIISDTTAYVYAPLIERGPTTIGLESIVTNGERTYWATLTDADTSAVDFHVPITRRLAEMTTATVRLVGVSKNASPSGNVVLHCAIRAIRPGTDTYVAHSITGEQSVTLTPAVQNRPVAATSASITINGTMQDGGELWGSCEVSASLTTSAQMTDFRLKAGALIRFQ